MAELVAIPKAELEKLEAARVALYEFLEEQTKDTYFLVRLTNITAPIWNVANRKWPELMGQGEAVAEVIENVVGVEIAWSHPPSHGRPPVGTKLYTHPAPAVDDGVVRDAARYRWLCEEIENGAVYGVSGALVELFDDTIYDNGVELSAAIDAAIKEQQDANRTL